MNPSLRAYINLFGGALLAGAIGWQVVADNPNWRVRLAAFLVPFLTSLVQQCRENPVQDHLDAIKAKLTRNRGCVSPEAVTAAVIIFVIIAIGIIIALVARI